ncbi:YhdP family phospholipid transporter [Marinobacterium marinum]|uniref:YhdP central domain-containing protein n=1 Tax=Marinobacterium marinum TaxID=2756129 RepID=A0A7W2AD27_9GAMM|nr:AsmA-like C-terminal region-containing protein [Marinobacterium marinum]MBA4503129.1 hypothetical protein [Marinobacterium marinum]
MRRHLSRAWWLGIIVLLLLALLLAAARLGLQTIDRWRPELQGVLSEALGAPVEIGRLQGQWHYALPVLSAHNIAISTRSEDGVEGHLRLRQLTLELDPIASLLSGALIFHRFEASGAAIRWNQRGGAWLHRPGAAPGAEASGGVSASAWERLAAVLLQQPYAVIRDAELTLVPESGQSLVITPADLELENSPAEHRLSGLFRMPLLGEAAEMKFMVETDSIQQQALDARYRLFLELEHLGPELFRLFGRQLGIEQLDVSTRIWAELEQRKLLHAKAEVSLAQLDLAAAGVPYPRSGRFDASLQPKGEEYQLQISRLQLEHEQARLDLPLVMAQGPLSLPPEHWQLGVAELDLGRLSSWLRQAPGMPESAALLLDELRPEGQLRPLTIHKPEGSGWQDMRLAADLEEVRVSAWAGAPMLAGINGRLETGLKQGRVDLISEDFAMHFPELFPDTWRYPEARGRVTWQLSDQGVHVASERLQLKDRHVQAAGRFSMDLPFDRRRQSELVLLIGMTDSDGSQASIYTPAKEVGVELQQWLAQAIQGGRLRQGGFLLRTGTRNNGAPRSPVAQLFFDVEDGKLAYQPGWPAVEQADLFVLVRDNGVAININQARLLNSEVVSGWAYLPPNGRTLQVETLLKGPLGDLDQVLKQTPLADVLGSSIQDWSLLDGRAESRLGLQIPLQDKPPQVALSVSLQQGQLAGQAGALQISDIEGRLHYSSEQGLTADRLQGRFLGQPVSARITNERAHYRIHLQGRSEMQQLQSWLALPVLSHARGVTPWQAVVDICERVDCPRLDVTTALEGIALDLPGILAKRAEQSAPMELALSLVPEVSLDRLDLQLPADGIAPLQIRARQAAEAPLTIGLEHPQLSGEVRLATAEQPAGLNLTHIQLEALMPDTDADAAEVPKTEQGAAGSSVVDYVSDQLPALDVRIDDLWFAHKPLGEWRFALRPEPGRVRIVGLEAYPEQLVLSGEAEWVQGEAGNTAISVNMAGDNLGRFLKSWGHDRIMETGQAEAMLQLQWPGAPWLFDWSRLHGELKFATTNTRLIETADSTNLLRVFGILNFNSVARRLRLDFSDLLRKGVSFDRISGHYRIENGLATTLEPLRMEGPSANMTLTGQVDLAAQQLDNTVEVALPISGNAPLAAILLGAPQVAGAVFVIDRLIGDKLERFSTLKYRLTGHWDDPELELQAGNDRDGGGAPMVPEGTTDWPGLN